MQFTVLLWPVVARIDYVVINKAASQKTVMTGKSIKRNMMEDGWIMERRKIALR